MSSETWSTLFEGLKFDHKLRSKGPVHIESKSAPNPQISNKTMGFELILNLWVRSQMAESLR